MVPVDAFAGQVALKIPLLVFEVEFEQSFYRLYVVLLKYISELSLADHQLILLVPLGSFLCMQELELVFLQFLLEQPKFPFIQSIIISWTAVHVKKHVGKQVIIIGLRNHHLSNQKVLNTQLFKFLVVE